MSPADAHHPLLARTGGNRQHQHADRGACDRSEAHRGDQRDTGEHHDRGQHPRLHDPPRLVDEKRHAQHHDHEQVAAQIVPERERPGGTGDADEWSRTLANLSCWPAASQCRGRALPAVSRAATPGRWRRAGDGGRPGAGVAVVSVVSTARYSRKNCIGPRSLSASAIEMGEPRDRRSTAPRTGVGDGIPEREPVERSPARGLTRPGDAPAAELRRWRSGPRTAATAAPATRPAAPRRAARRQPACRPRSPGGRGR